MAVLILAEGMARIDHRKYKDACGNVEWMDVRKEQ